MKRHFEKYLVKNGITMHLSAALLCFLFVSGARAGQLVALSSAVYAGVSGDQARAIAIDSSNNVFVAGYRFGTVSGNDNFCTVKYDNNLNVTTMITYDFSGGDQEYAAALDNSGNVFVAGQRNVTGNDYCTVKYDNNLNLISSATLDSGTNDQINGAVVDGSGNLFVTGSWNNSACAFTVKYDNNLNIISSVTYNGGGLASANGIAADSAGNVFIVGAESGYQLYIQKYDNNLQPLASSAFVSKTASEEDAPRFRIHGGGGGGWTGGSMKAVAVDKAGNVFVTGNVYDPNGNLYAAKYTNNLVLISSVVYTDSSPSGLALDGSGNVYVTGYNSSNGYFTVAYSNSLCVLSSATYGAASNGTAQAIATDRSGNIFVTGYSMGVHSNFFTVKYRGAPAITSVTPASAVQDSTATVTINGSMFVEGCQASFGTGITVNSVNFVSAGQLTANITLAADAVPGSQAVMVTNSDGLQASGAFTVNRKVSANTNIDPSTGGIATIQPESGIITINVPGGTFSSAVVLEISTAAVPGVNQNGINATNIGIQITDSAGLQPSRSITITVYYRASDIAGMDPNKLSLARYDAENSRWIPIPTVVYASQNMLVGTIDHFSVYAVVQLAPSKNLNSVKAYPMPYYPARGLLTIDNLTPNAKIRIYTITGELVKAVDYAAANGRASWDGKNNNGAEVASGVYVACIDSYAGTKKIKIAVER